MNTASVTDSRNRLSMVTIIVVALIAGFIVSPTPDFISCMLKGGLFVLGSLAVASVYRISPLYVARSRGGVILISIILAVIGSAVVEGILGLIYLAR